MEIIFNCMDYSIASDSTLWQFCQADDLKAYTALFDRYAGKLYKQIYPYIKDEMQAEELVMDLLFRIWEKRHDGIMQADVAAYLYRSAQNEVLKYLRQKIPKKISIHTIPENKLIDSNKTDRLLIDSDLQRIYETSIAQLSPQRRAVFLLNREQQMTYKQIAQSMNLSINTIENYMVSALRQLRSSSLASMLSLTSLFFLAFSC